MTKAMSAAIAIAIAGCGGTQGASAADASLDADVDANDGSADVSSDSGAHDAPKCTGDLSNVGNGDFHVSFMLTTNQAGIVALASQRGICMHGRFWDVHLVNGAISPETDDGVRYTSFNSTRTVNDGKPHAIVVARVAGTLG